MADTTLRMLEPFESQALHLKNRVVMAPLTRSRAEKDGTPTALMAEYYAQRATAGLIIAEATHISQEGQGFVYMPGIFTQRHIEGWRKVTDAVHAAGGTIYLQLYHSGRVGHSHFSEGKPPVGPSPTTAPGLTRTYAGKVEFETPTELSQEEIDAIVADYAQAARNAIEAGFDGVEVHGANGYLPNQFLADGTNHRTDAYGGTPEKRSRFIVEVIDAVVAAVGAGRTGVRLAPLNVNHGAIDATPLETYSHLIALLNSYGLAYLHLMENWKRDGIGAHFPLEVAQTFRPMYSGTLIASTGLTKEKAEQLLETGTADLVAFGTAYLANPDLPERFRTGSPLNEPDRATFYTGDEKGYTDYPTLSQPFT